jgi:hypothetical protein
VENLKAKTDALFAYLDPIKINFSPVAIIIEDKILDKKIIYAELSKLFHLRKIKGFQIASGITKEELALCLEKISMPVKEVLKQGGLKKILDAQNVSHFSAEELDYSMFLKDEGEEVKDVWAYMLNNVMEKPDAEKVRNFIQNFDKIAASFKAKDFLENHELKSDIKKLLTYINKDDAQMYQRCASSLLKNLVREKATFTEAELDGLSSLFDDFSSQQFTQVFLQELAQDENFDNASFAMFMHLIDNKKHPLVAEHIEGTILKNDQENFSPKAIKKMSELFKVSDNPVVMTIYKQLVLTLSKSTSQTGIYVLDETHLSRNYHYMLLHMLFVENDHVRLETVVAAIKAEWDNLSKQEGYGLFIKLHEIIRQKKQAAPIPAVEELSSRIDNFIENLIWQETVPKDLIVFIDKLERTTLDFNAYVHKIFNEGKVNRYALRLLFRFFPGQIPDFCQQLSNKSADAEFMGTVVGELPFSDPKQAGALLETIYGFANDFIRVEALKAMKFLPEQNEKFLMPIIKGSDYFLRKEAVAVFASDSSLLPKALDALFSIPSAWGSKNSYLIENINLAQELVLKEASQHIINLSKRPFFWNKQLRLTAKKVLGEWNA